MGTLNDDNSEQRSKVRRNAWLLGCVALAFYVGFILMSVSRA
jgi:uncharacterized membrane protein (DUF485 family)